VSGALHARIEVHAERPEQLERAAAEAFEAGALGLEERDGPPAALCVYVLADAAAAVCAALGALPGIRLGEVEALPERAWSEAWKEGLEPIVISERLLVRPSFRAAPAGFRGAELVIEPGQAFGTGGHASTRLALEAIDALPPALLAGARVLDVGCGSGVLALAALALGAERALACDIDPLATAATRRAARENGFPRRLVAFTGSLAALGARADGVFELVVANLLRRELEPLLAAIARLRAPGGAVLLSGLLASDLPPLEACLVGLGLRTLASREAAEPSGDAWLSLLVGDPRALSQGLVSKR